MAKKRSPMRESMEQMVNYLESLPKDENGSITLTPLQQISLIAMMDVYAEREALIWFYHQGLANKEKTNGSNFYFETYHNE